MVVCERGEVVAVGVSLPTTTTSCVCVRECVCLMVKLVYLLLSSSAIYVL